MFVSNLISIRRYDSIYQKKTLNQYHPVPAALIDFCHLSRGVVKGFFHSGSPGRPFGLLPNVPGTSDWTIFDLLESEMSQEMSQSDMFEGCGTEVLSG